MSPYSSTTDLGTFDGERKRDSERTSIATIDCAGLLVLLVILAVGVLVGTL